MYGPYNRKYPLYKGFLILSITQYFRNDSNAPILRWNKYFVLFKSEIVFKQKRMRFQFYVFN